MTDANSIPSGLEAYARAKNDLLAGVDELRHAGEAMKAALEKWRLEEEKNTPFEVDALLDKLDNVRKSVDRDSMKVVFVGLTSAGKSTTINAILGDKVLPSGFGHTTNRFISLLPSKTGIAKLVDPTTEKQLELTELDSLANALSDFSQSADDSDNDNYDDIDEDDDGEVADANSPPLELFWPRDKCSLLENDIIIHDSPGLSLSKSFDAWIERDVSDADVFILVVNGEMTMGVHAENFFQVLRKQITRPNVFVVFNRWELAPRECNRVRKQLLTQAERLLISKLNSIDKEDIPSRVFFLSSKETMDDRVTNGRGTFSRNPISDSQHLTWENTPQTRKRAFHIFEDEFSTATSQHAITTRLHAKMKESLEIASKHEMMMLHVVDVLTKRVGVLEESLRVAQSRRAEVQRKFSAAKTHCLELAATVPLRIQNMVDSVTTDILTNELPKIMQVHPTYCEFDTQDSIAAETIQLAEQVERSLQVELSRTLTEQVMDLYTRALREVQGQFEPLMAEGEHSEHALSNSFRGNMTLDCSHLPQNFSPDITFHFRWGLTSLASILPAPLQFMAHRFGTDISSRLQFSYRRAVDTVKYSDGEDKQKSTGSRLVEAGTTFGADVAYMLWDLTTNTPYGLVLAAALPYATKLVRKPWFRNIIAVGAASYAAVYAFEYLSFNTAAKDRLFREQFLDHARDKLMIAAASRARDAKEIVEMDIKESVDKLMVKVEKNDTLLRETIAKSSTDLVHTTEIKKDAMALLKKITAAKERLLSTLRGHSG